MIQFNKKANILIIATFMCFGFFMYPIFTSAQNDVIPENKKKMMHQEVPDDPYMPLSISDRQSSTPYWINSGDFFNIQVNTDADGLNIIGDAANEPSITIDPTNPDRMVIGWRQFDNVNSNFRQAGYAYSLDGGESWTFPGSIDPGVFRSDPVLDVDTEGNFYYNSLTSDGMGNYTCNVYKAGGNDVVWDEGTFAQGGDKQWMHIDKTGGIGNNNIYAYWTTYYSICYPGAFTRSTDEGGYYEDCAEITGEPRWGTLAVDHESNLYLVGVGGWGDDIQVSKSTDAKDESSDVSWEITTTVDLDGNLTGWTPVNPDGLMGQAWIDVDKSNGPGQGNVYVLASVARSSNTDPADVMFARSTDGGLTWDDPVRINDDFSSFYYQWFGTMSVAPNGRIDVIWLDTRDATSSQYMSALYYSYSLDQGETWSENLRLTDSFDPHLGWPQQEKMGDYFDMVSDNEYAHLAWANTLNMEQDVYYARIKPLYTSIDDIPLAERSFGLQSYPNPLIDQSTIRYKLHQAGEVKLIITDISGRILVALVDNYQNAGSYEFALSADKLGNGIYYCVLETETKAETIKISVLK